MADFETRIRASLERAADAAPEPAGLAAAARRRLRRRRTAVGAAVAVVALVAAVPLGLATLGSDDGRGPQVATQAPSPAPSADPWRTETWHDVTLQVPATWGHGGTTTWCTSADTPADAVPSVSRPGEVSAMIACTPMSGYGVKIEDLATMQVDWAHPSGHVWQYDTEGVDVEAYPDGAWLSVWYDDEVAVTIVTPERGLTEEIVASVRRIDGRDPNGCPTDLGAAEASRTGDAEGFSLCRYDGLDLLDASGVLPEPDAARLLDAIEAAPVRAQLRKCAAQLAVLRTVLLDDGQYLGTVVTGDDCLEGIHLSGVTRELTDDVRSQIALTRT
ncbi:hypothetical protein DDE18_03565 [Nocardioides gansuensis]|uniref:Uncharacterized protein n=1 Tax=Nocardioides gansuensis TaxID=2138300 RepID=A0A2T8FG37_9ACTN|nr:hypothetical protein [Nocardioides gansuensis]PVG84688.1 hypothetical protein DDE18_03565 [Nocardioides gansuensis]